MAEKKISDVLADLEIGGKTDHNGTTYLRVPGGFIVLIGNTSAFVPLSEVACGELGIEFEK